MAQTFEQAPGACCEVLLYARSSHWTCISAAEPHDVKDVPRVYDGVVEPFMLDVRDLGKKGVKLVWWFVAELDQYGPGGKGQGEDQFRADWLDVRDALQRLTFQRDREVLLRAVELVEGARNGVRHATNGVST
ncbi:hypothetical protein CHU98_g9180 [Xylaria longipes]|nr:hypothetical protein CHU98_g9180 [Xylaria longipes]